jgi:aryl-alcohol dehydrogenase-like predicted oxidoreductase
MRRVALGRTGIETSALGMGCASLGSRVDAAAGARALAAALDAGVTWLDLAPVYGAGRAEEIAAGVIRGRREEVQICTKVGLRLAGGVGGGLRAALMPAARRAIGALGPLAGPLRRAAPRANAALPLTPELIRGSLEASLRRLGTDRVELYALHAVPAAELARPEILRALEEVRAAGKARAIGVASDAAAALAALDAGAPFDVVQLPLAPPDAPPDPVLPRAAAAGTGVVVHSVLGETLARLAARAGGDPALAARVREAAGAAPGSGPAADTGAAVARLLMARAFAANPAGVVLVSMLSPRSLAANRAAAEAFDPAAPRPWPAGLGLPAG